MKKILFIFILVNLLFSPVPHASAQETSIPFPANQDNGKIRILLVPGHDTESWGAQYGNVKEAYMNLAVATRIYKILKKDKRFQVYITREGTGYAKEFAEYLSLERDEIISFIEEVKEEMQSRIESGDFVKKENPPHNRASESTATTLYGINKWANENGMDAVIHIHFNDHVRKTKWTIGKRKGFAIYIPEEQMANSTESTRLARSIFTELRKKYTTSNYSKELGGLVPDQTLIALGSNGSLLPGVRSVLMEYGYIYEKIFRSYASRHKAYDDMANRTAIGMKNYFLSE